MKQDHPEIWSENAHWFDRLDTWVSTHRSSHSSPGTVDVLGTWQRAAYQRFDLESRAYQDMVFFHPFVRRVFFDTLDPASTAEQESLLRCYTIPIARERRVRLTAQDSRGRQSTLDVEDLRLFLFANGIGILSIGVQSTHLPLREVLWINEMIRKVYPTSGRQVREGRMPSRVAFTVEENGKTVTASEERFLEGSMLGFQPPLAHTITSLLYFADYQEQEYEPLLDERMIVYTFVSVDPATVPPDYIHSPEYQIFLSRLLFVDRWGTDYRYEPAFVQEQMQQAVYRRWAHEGTYYGFSSYSNITVTVGAFDCGEHQLAEGFLIHRHFDTRYYLMAIVALFYRVTLLAFAERTALVSKRLFRDQEEGKVAAQNIELTTDLRADFLHFSNYWFFSELANKDEEIEHFALQTRAYRIGPMKEESEGEIEKLNSSLNEYYQRRNTEAVNRLAMLSMILGAGAVMTGYFGMNFGQEFASFFFDPQRPSAKIIHISMIVIVSVFAFGALVFSLYLIALRWDDYRQSLSPRRSRPRRDVRSLLRPQRPPIPRGRKAR